MKVLLFPGQGAQKLGMAHDLAERFEPAAQALAEIDAALDSEITPIMWGDNLESLTLTHNAQPAILAHSMAVLSVLKPVIGDTVVAAAGHSLGEYSAWVAADALPASAAAILVRRRGTLMYEAGQQRPGAMAAVLGLPTADVEGACIAASGDDGVVVAANLNAPDQTVISGDPVAVDRAEAGCRAAGARRVIPLQVSGAFHSPLMEPAVEGLREALRVTPFANPKFAVIANVTAEPVDDRGAAIRLLEEQITMPVRWVDSMRRMATAWPDAEWLELGPGSVLTGLLRKTAPEIRCTPIGTADQLSKWLEAGQ